MRFLEKFPTHSLPLFLYTRLFKLQTRNQNCSQIDFRITSSLSFWYAIATIPYPRLPLVCLKQPISIQSNSYNSSVSPFLIGAETVKVSYESCDPSVKSPLSHEILPVALSFLTRDDQVTVNFLQGFNKTLHLTKIFLSRFWRGRHILDIKSP